MSWALFAKGGLHEAVPANKQNQSGAMGTLAAITGLAFLATCSGQWKGMEHLSRLQGVRV